MRPDAKPVTVFSTWAQLEAAGELPAWLLVEWVRLQNARAWLVEGGR